ncbi:MAG: hypothetical protein ACI8P3_001393 [Saprospiraceae bacterium]|jgi:hypothetical protein
MKFLENQRIFDVNYWGTLFSPKLVFRVVCPVLKKDFTDSLKQVRNN